MKPAEVDLARYRPEDIVNEEKDGQVV